MKFLYIVRHAKSSWIDFSKSDFERPLNERGKRDAPDMATRVKKRGVYVDAFVSSPANRAKSTCKIFCKEFDFDTDKVIFLDELYHASINTFYDVVRNLDNKYSAVVIFSHNPGITEFVNSLCENIRVDNVATCGVFGIEAKINDWKEFKERENQYLFFDYPKAI